MGDFSFKREYRLLTARDFSKVFGNAVIRVPHAQFLLLAVPNGLDHPRIGLVLAKKNLRLAVQRNRVRRLVRESFRVQRQTLPPVDIVILARRGLADKNNAEIVGILNQLWQRLHKSFAKNARKVSAASQPQPPRN